MYPTVRITLLFVKNRFRSYLSLGGLRKCILAVFIVLVVYGYVYVNTYPGRADVVDGQRNMDKYPELARNLTTSYGKKEIDNLFHPYVFLPSNCTLAVEPKVLLVYDRQSTFTAKAIRVFLESQRVKFTVYLHSRNKTFSLVSTSLESNNTVGQYSLLIFAGFESLLEKWTAREKLPYFNYCKFCNVPMFLISRCDKDRYRFNSSSNVVPPIITSLKSTFISSNAIELAEVTVSKTLYFSKPGLKLTKVPNATWVVFHPVNLQGKSNENKRSDEQIHLTQESNLNMSAMLSNTDFDVYLSITYHSDQQRIIAPSIVVDKGLTDGIRKVIIGSPWNFWLTEVLLLDLVREYSPENVLRFGRKRWILVDIDDIFVAPEGRKMNVADVEALIEVQAHFRTFVPGFTFNLGFCGYYYSRGTPAEQEGSKYLVQNAHHFTWFGHIFNHFQPHLLEEDKLLAKMWQNSEFAKNHSIRALDTHYAVSPHHSGVYPIYPPLYRSWKKVWNISMTSTEEYPHLYPPHLRRGFMHSGIMVVPRQTCQLYTHTFTFGTLPGGKNKLLSAANGGEVFTTLLHNPVTIFMTHVANYAQDRLSLLLFSQLFHFVTENTQLQLVSDQPLALGKEYFKIFPEDKLPLWTNPYKDKRHLDILPPRRNYTRLPSLLVIGPQKTGTTALYEFLKLHPNILSNYPTSDHYEEVQFFSNDTLYQYGIDWYMEQFPYRNARTEVLFEKSATYFTHPLAPLRAHALLPAAKLIVILHDPVKRAYSWYQHMVAHQNPTALAHKFSEVIRTSSADKKLLTLRNHCLQPGYYHKYITTWLEHFSHKQIHFLDGDCLIKSPVAALNVVQNFLNIEYMDYSSILSYSERKGFFCVENSSSDNLKCLGIGKGRKYAELEQDDRHFLEQHYDSHNQDLYLLLSKYGRRIPEWLQNTVI